MKLMVILALPHLRSVASVYAVALIFLFPAVSMAKRPVVKPHHKKTPAQLKLAALKAASKSTAAYRYSGAAGLYPGGTTTTTMAGFNLALAVTNVETLAVAGGNMTFGGTLALSNQSIVSDLLKSGTGTLTIAAGATYSGSTTLNAGTLALTTATLADTGTLSLATGATLNLNFAGSDTINQLRIDGITQIPGTWGSLTSSATYKTALITGTGILNVAGNGGTFVVDPGTLQTSAITLATTGGSTTTTAGTLTLNGTTSTITNGGTLTVTGIPSTTTTISTATLLTNSSLTGATESVLVLNTGTFSPSAYSLPSAPSAASAPEPSAGPDPVPEPSAALLLLIGSGLLSQRRRRA